VAYTGSSYAKGVCGADSEPRGMSPGNYASGAGSAGAKSEPSGGGSRGTRRAASSAVGDNESRGRRSPMNSTMTTKGNARRGGY
jgi:hypothetical protein